MRKSIFLVLVGIFALGVFLRVYGIGSNYYFEGELGKELLYLRSYSLAGRLPTIGLTTSHEWLSYGPFYYWIMLPIFNLFSGNPFILFWAALVAASLGMILNYFVVSKIADRSVALYSTLIQAVSPLLIWQTQLSKLHVFFFVLSPVLMYLLYLVLQGEKKWVFWAGAVFGLMFSFHFSQIPLLFIVVFLFWIKRNVYKWGDWLKFTVGVSLPNITLIWQDRNLVLWLPYRILNIADKNPAGTGFAFIEYFGRNLFWNKNLWILGLLVFLGIFAHYIWTNRKKFTKDFLPFYLISAIGFELAANVLHGAFPIHYFLPIFTTVPILYAIYLSKIRWGFLVLILIFALNFSGYFGFDKPANFIDYSKQLATANFILSDSKGNPFSIKRIGPFDYFSEAYSQNYKYLILWKGGDLVESSKNVYTIIEKNGNVIVQK